MDDCFIEDYSFAHNDSGLFFLACSTMQVHAYVFADPQQLDTQLLGHGTRHLGGHKRSAGIVSARFSLFSLIKYYLII